MTRTQAAPPWRLVWALSATQIVSWGSVYYAFGVLLVPMQAEFGWAQSMLTGAYSMALGISALVLVPTGVWIDRRGGRTAMTSGSLLAVAMFGLLSVNHSLAGFYLIWAGLGLVMATTFYEAAFAVIEIGFGPAYRKGITVLTFAGGFASTAFIPITQWLVDAFGWRGALVGLAAANLLVCVPLHALLPGRPARRGPLHDGAHEGSEPARGQSERRATVGPGAPAPMRRALASLKFWTLATAYTGYALVVGALGVHLIPLLGAKGFSAGEVVLIASLVGPMQVAGRLAQYGLGDTLEVRRLSRIVFATLPIAMAVLLLAPAQSLFIGFFVVFYGVGMGIATILRGIAMPELFGRENYAVLSNLLSAPSVAARAIAPFLASLIVAGFGNYEALVWANLGVALAALLAIWIATRRNI
jgi:MFS family permease